MADERVKSGEPTKDELIPTRASLLARLKNLSEETSWKDFFDTYWRLIYLTARRYGLGDAEAQEVVQETMIGLARKLPEFRYNPKVCSFKTYLMNLTLWRIRDRVRQEKTRERLQHVINEYDHTVQSAWENDWQANLATHAIERVKGRTSPKHFQIYDLCVLEERGARQTAALLNVSLPLVYVCKHRIGKAIAKEMKTLLAKEDHELLA